MTRVGFRFAFIYIGLFSLNTQILSGLFPIRVLDVPELGVLWPMRQIVFWTALHVFGVKTPLVYKGSGSGDKTFDWVLAFCILVISVLATAAWSAIDRRRKSYAGLYKWFRLFVRFALASEMVLYGIVKVIPLQMPFPFLSRLVEPYGNFSPMGALWYSIGAAPAYEVFAGCAETLGGLLLFFPRTATAGALICLADMTQVFALNMTFDVPVKLFAFHLIVLSLFLLIPDFRRIGRFFFLNCATEPPMQFPLFKSQRANRLALAAQVIFGIFLVGSNLYGGWRSWHTYGGGRPKPALYGIWNVDELSIDGKLRLPLLTDPERWRRAIFDFPNNMSFQRMDDSFVSYGASINAKDRTIALTKRDDKNWKATLTFNRSSADRMTLDGNVDGHQMHIGLGLVDRNKFLLVNRGFHWVQEYPYNR